MLQFDRRVNGSKFVRGSHSKPPTNFVSRNKRALRDKSRSHTDAKCDQGEKSKARPGSRKASERQLAGKRDEKSVSINDGKAAEQVDTVTISKSYLDDLLRMSIMRDNVKPQREAMKSDRDADLARSKETVTHINLEATEIPGLGVMSPKHVNVVSTPRQAPQHTEHAQNMHQPVNNSQGLSPHDKWLQELAAQVEEQKARKERNRLTERQTTVEEYFPFGRPGGGAPIISQTGQLLTDYRSRGTFQDQGNKPSRNHTEVNEISSRQLSQAPTKTVYGGHGSGDELSTNTYGTLTSQDGVSGSVLMSPRQGGPPPHQEELYNTTPRFARGAGPHVDQYMMREMNEKRRKQMEHMEFVRQQVAEKERAKMEERLRREREDALEEARLAMERDRMKADFQREKERARRKEMEAYQRQAILQQRIIEAEESAKKAKMEARGVVNSAHQPTVSFDTNYVTRSVDSGEGVFSSLSKSEFRSPSMLQLANPSAEAGRHGDANPPPTQRSRANCVRKGVQTGRTKLAKGTQSQGGQTENGSERTRRISRIPVMQQSMGVASKSRTTINSRYKAQKPGTENVNIQNNKTSNKRFRGDGGRSVNAATVTRRPAVERSLSPPVPAVAKRLRQQNFDKKDSLVSPHRTPPPESVKSTFIRSLSPPVPTVAKRLRNKQRHTTETVYPAYERAASPPVPAVARRLRNEEVSQGHEIRHQSLERGPSPPVPTVAKRLQQSKVEYDSELTTLPNKSQSSPVPAATKLNLLTGNCDEVQMSINRPPSCKPNTTPLSSPVAMTTSTDLPAIPMATSNHHHDNQQPMVQSQSSNRQRLILQQLTMLKEGILTQQNNIDHRLQTILNQNKQCNF